MTSNGLHLNLGCGHFLIEGHENIDAFPYEPGVTVLRFPPLPYEEASVESVYAGHCFEHICPWELMPLLAECKRVLRPGGSLTIVVPDADKARLLAESGRLTLTWYALAVQGERFDMMPHFLIFNPKRVCEMLEIGGFVIDETYHWKSDSRVHDTTVIFQCGSRGIKQ
jgi:SAM-dependent methyltransferase